MWVKKIERGSFVFYFDCRLLHFNLPTGRQATQIRLHFNFEITLVVTMYWSNSIPTLFTHLTNDYGSTIMVYVSYCPAGIYFRSILPHMLPKE